MKITELRNMLESSDTATLKKTVVEVYKLLPTNSQIDASVQIFQLGYDYWMRVYTELSKENVIAFGELDFIQSIAKYIKRGNLPTTAQCKRLIKIITKAEDCGYIMPVS